MRWPRIWMLAIVAALPLRALADTPFDLQLVPLKQGIYLLQRPDVLRQPVEPNAVIIVNETDVVVVDPGGVPASAENAIRLIRSVTDKPVSVLINTHWHGDHVLGNQVYRREYPNVRIVAHENTYRDITGAPMAYIARQDEQFSAFIRDLEALDAKGELTAPRRQLLADVRLTQNENRKVRVTPPDLTFSDGVTLHRGAREIQIRWLGRGNTEGDAIVWLPQERILASGDLVVHPIPYGFGSFPREWGVTLNRLAGFDFEILVPGHGEPLRDRDYIAQLQEMLASVREQAAAAVKKGLDLEATRAAMDLSVYEQRICGDDALRKRLFKAWWADPITRSAWLEARGEPIIQGAADETG
ncbi:MAG: MBL fold metallo-hydrolase [Sinimarinibacterium sp.]